MTCDQLEGERQPVDEPAEPVGRRLVPRRHREASVHEARPVLEEDERVLRRQRTDRDQRLVEDAETLAARDKHPDLRARGEEPPYLIRDFGKAALAAIEDHESRGVPEAFDQPVGRIDGAR